VLTIVEKDSTPHSGPRSLFQDRDRSFRSWFALFRYATLFGGTAPALRLAAGSEDLDPRLLAVLAEEVAVGVCGVVAREVWCVQHLADVFPLLGSDVALMTPPVDPAHPRERPDFIGLTPSHEAVFFESKGAVGTASTLRTARTKGKVQVRNVASQAHPHRRVNGTPCADRVVVATHFCIAGKHTRSETTTYVDDPPEADVHQERDRPPSDMAVRLAYAKALNLGGAAGLGALLVGRSEWPAWTREQGTIEVGGVQLVPLGEFPTGGWLAVEAGVWRALTAGPTDLLGGLERPLAGVGDILRKSREEPAARDSAQLVLLNNGIALLW
jgi:hypothetical protein